MKGFVHGNILCGWTINFLSEGRSGEQLRIRTVRRDHLSFLDSAVRISGGKEVCRLLLAWRPR